VGQGALGGALSPRPFGVGARLNEQTGRPDVRDIMAERIRMLQTEIEGLSYFLNGLPPKPEPIPEAAEHILYLAIAARRL